MDKKKVAFICVHNQDAVRLMKDIAESVGIVKSALYKHFESKEGDYHRAV